MLFTNNTWLETPVKRDWRIELNRSQLSFPKSQQQDLFTQ